MKAMLVRVLAANTNGRGNIRAVMEQTQARCWLSFVGRHERLRPQSAASEELLRQKLQLKLCATAVSIDRSLAVALFGDFMHWDALQVPLMLSSSGGEWPISAMPPRHRGAIWQENGVRPFMRHVHGRHTDQRVSLRQTELGQEPQARFSTGMRDNIYNARYRGAHQ